jgi:putative redox protein
MQTAQITWTNGQQFICVTPSGHAMAVDADRERNTAAGPMELLLVALATCTATDIVIILEKKRQKLLGLEISVSGERAPEPPRVWTQLEVVFRLRGALDEKAVQDAVHLSESKYCSVAAMLRSTAQLSFRYEILSPEPTVA